jgi:hypothetical protein
MNTPDPDRDLTPIPPSTSGSGVFSAEELNEANRRHDLKYGWSFLWPTIFSNAARLPETVIGKLPWA